MLKNRLLKNTFVIMIGNMGTKILMFFIVPLYTTWLSTAEYGMYDTLLTIGSFLIPVMTLQLEQSVFRIGIEQNNKINIAAKNAMVYILKALLLFSVCYIFIKRTEISLLFLLYLIGAVFQSLFCEYIRGCSKIYEYAIVNILFTIILCLSNFILVGAMHLGIKGILISYIIAQGLFLIQFCFRNNEIFKVHTQKPLFIEQLKFSIPLIPNTICFWITNLSDRFLILYFLGLEYNGIYAVATKIPTIINIFYSAFVLAWQEEAIHIINENKNSELNIILKRVICLLFSLIWIIIVVLKYIIFALFDDIYQKSIIVAEILMIATVYLCISQFISGIMMATKETKTIGVSTIVAAIINVIVNILFLNYGLWIASISTLIAYLIMLAMRLCSVSQVLDIRKIYLRVFAFSMISCLLLGISQITHLFCDIFILVIIMVFVYCLNKEWLKKIVHSSK